MTNQYKFSVVIPFFNAEDSILKALDSVLNQTNKAHQIITIDDGSTDGSAELIKNYQERYQEIEYFYQTNNGVSTARNLGIKKAKNENIYFLDADDLWLPNKIELHLNHLKLHLECVSSFTNYILFNESHGNLVSFNNYRNILPLNSRNLSLDLSRVNGSSSSFLGKRSNMIELGGFREDLKFGEDLELWIRYASKHKICEIDQIALAIRTNDLKLKNEKLDRSWKISKLYFDIWRTNKIEFGDKKSRFAARKILRIDLRRNFMKPFNLFVSYPLYFKKKDREVFRSVFRNLIWYYVYFFKDISLDIHKIFKNKDS
jgi:glycosyltransferase involved in cell wall biosynthesis